MSEQVNITLPDGWKDILEEKAIEQSMKRRLTVTYMDLIRESINGSFITKNQEDLRADFHKFAMILKAGHPFKGSVTPCQYDFQKRWINHLEANQFSIGSKFRQGGFTTNTLAYLLWKCMYRIEERVLVMTRSDRCALDCSAVVRRFINTMPLAYRPLTSKCNDHQIQFSETGSTIHFYVPEAACGRSVSLLFIDEAAFVPDMDRYWKGLYPVVCQGRVIVVSTPKKKSWFNKTLIDAKNLENKFVPYECSYLEHPEYAKPEWITQTRACLGEKAWKQEVLQEPLD